MRLGGRAVRGETLLRGRDDEDAEDEDASTYLASSEKRGAAATSPEWRPRWPEGEAGREDPRGYSMTSLWGRARARAPPGLKTKASRDAMSCSSPLARLRLRTAPSALMGLAEVLERLAKLLA